MSAIARSKPAMAMLVQDAAHVKHAGDLALREDHH
jgi:hypothetical protein